AGREAAAGLLLERLTVVADRAGEVTGPIGLGPTSETVPRAVPPPVRLVVLTLTLPSAGGGGGGEGKTTSEALCVKLEKAASMRTTTGKGGGLPAAPHPWFGAQPEAIVKLPLVDPAGTVTLVGAVAQTAPQEVDAKSHRLSGKVVSTEGAGLRVTVPVTVLPATTGLGLSVNPVKVSWGPVVVVGVAGVQPASAAEAELKPSATF